MKYKLDLSQKSDLSMPAASGSGGPQEMPFYAWLPSTWPPAPTAADEQFILTLKRIFEDSILSEINNVISDAKKSADGLQFRGHVIAISLLCALDAISSYGYGARCGKQIPDFVQAHFPAEFHPHADALLYVYRHAMVHSWNLFGASISPEYEPIANKGTISFGLMTLFSALISSTESFLEDLAVEATLQENALARYKGLRGSVRSSVEP